MSLAIAATERAIDDDGGDSLASAEQALKVTERRVDELDGA